MLYALVRGLLRFVLRVFFRQIERSGAENLPEGAPVIFAGNHQNSLLDPALLIAFTPRVVSVAAKDVLFKSPILRPVLVALGAVPIVRRHDHDGAAQPAASTPAAPAVDNESAFRRLFTVLEAGGAMGIFPEGLSHDEAQLQRLKTGAARVALGIVARPDAPPGLRLALIPTGLVYVRPKRFRSRALIQYGAPIWVDGTWADRARQDEREAVTALTRTLEEALRALTINAEDWDTVRVLDCVRRLYQPQKISLEQRAELTRRFNTHYPQVRDREDVKLLFARVRAHLDALRAVGLGERDLSRELDGVDIALRLTRHLALMLVWLPLAIPGLLLFVPLLLGVRWVGPRFSPRRDVIGTTKLVLGMVLSFGAVAVVGAVVSWYAGAGAGLLSVVLAFVSFHATLRVLERVTLATRVLPTLWRLLRLRAEVAALRQEHRELTVLVRDAVERHRPAELAPLFPERALFDASDHLT